MFFTIIIASNKNDEWEVGWLKKLSVNILVDILLSPVILIIYKYNLYRYKYIQTHFDGLAKVSFNKKILCNRL